MSEKRLDNSIFLMFLATNSYMLKHNMSTAQFNEIDKKYSVLNYIYECPDIFDNMTSDEMAMEIEHYVSD